MRTPQISLTFVKKPKPGKNDTTSESPQIDWDTVGQAAAVAQETAETMAKVLFVAYAGKKLIDTACEIAVIAARAKL